MIDAERLLIVAPHPDDEILGCGGTLALAAERGAQVHVLVVFDGAAGDPEQRFEDEDYVARRRDEACAGGSLVGVENYHFWGLPEGHLVSDEELEEGAARLARLVHELQPDLILAPWEGDSHPDHQTVARAVRRMVEAYPIPGDVWGFEVWSPLEPEYLVDVSSVWLEKVAALERHVTQLAYDDLVTRMTSLASRHESGLKEAFRRLEVQR
jgi:LmbE family N-acetylglucosaminyl deacetylase